MSDKPIKVKPHFYACCLEALQQIARDAGYNLLVHGSMNRDLDLLAVPWTDNPKPHLEVLQDLDRYLRGVCITTLEGYSHGKLPGGRDTYVIQIQRGEKWNNYIDAQYYLDISFTPLVVNP